jgi:acid phosphatase type 7
MNFFSFRFAQKRNAMRTWRSLRGLHLPLLACLLSLDATSHAQSEQTEHGRLAQGRELTGIPVYAAGDIADCRRVAPEGSGAAKTAALIEAELAEHPQAAVLSLGDNTYPDGHPSEFEHCYESTWGSFKHRTYPAPGNHEYKTPRARGYFGYFGDAAGTVQRGYYSFQLGDWHVVSLNSNLEGAALAAQLEWLKTDLERNPARCTLAYWHHPLISSGGHGNVDVMQAAWRILAEANVELVLAAHDHHYERFAPMDIAGKPDDAYGIRQFIVGTGGARLTKFRLFKRHSEARNNQSLGVLKLILGSGNYAWQFLSTEPGVYTDQGKGNCH